MSRKRIDPKLPIAPMTGDDPAVPLMKPDRFMDRLVRRLNELFREFDGTVAILDEGTYLGQADGLNFVGTAVTATLNDTGIADITVTGGSSGITGITIEDEGITQGSPASVDTINFVGAPVTASVASNVATVTVVAQQNPLYVYFA